MKLLDIVNKFDSRDSFIKAVDVELLKLMEENPDFIYSDGSGCHYNSGPNSNRDLCNGCIFGQALQNLGWSDIGELCSGLYIGDLFYEECNMFEVPEYWSEIQSDQDEKFPWGELKEYLNV